MADRKDSDREVMTSLPRTRPTRRSTKRDSRPPAAAAEAKAEPTPEPKAKTRPRPRADAAGRPRKPPAAEPRRKVPPAGYAAPRADAAHDGRAGPTELLSTAVQAAGELAQIGMTIGRQTLKGMLDRLPRP